MTTSSKENEWLRGRISYLVRKQVELNHELHAAKAHSNIMTTIALVGWLVVVIRAAMGAFGYDC